MGLEAATYVNQLVSTNPVGASDPKSQGDDHLRLIKAALLASFPNIGGAMTISHTVLNLVQDAANLTAGVLANARVQASNVTQHQAALAIAGSQLTGTVADARLTGNVPLKNASNTFNGGTQFISAASGTAALHVESPSGTKLKLYGDTGGVALVDARNASDSAGGPMQIQASTLALVGSSVTIDGTSAHNAALFTAGALADARVAQSNVTQHQAALAIACSQLTGNMPDARIVASNVTQHQAALAIAASQITSGTLGLARGGTGQTTQLGITREVTKAWTIQSDPGGTPSGTAGDVFAYY